MPETLVENVRREQLTGQQVPDGSDSPSARPNVPARRPFEISVFLLS